MGVSMAAEKYEITVAGRTFLVGSEKGEKHVRAVADYVEQHMQAVAGTFRTADTTRLAIMTAITLAEEVLELSAYVNGFHNGAV